MTVLGRLGPCLFARWSHASGPVDPRAALWPRLPLPKPVVAFERRPVGLNGLVDADAGDQRNGGSKSDRSSTAFRAGTKRSPQNDRSGGPSSRRHHDAAEGSDLISHLFRRIPARAFQARKIVKKELWRLPQTKIFVTVILAVSCPGVRPCKGNRCRLVC
jgi:hypothetical protein